MLFDTWHGHFSYWWCNLDLKSRSIHCLRSWVTFPPGILSYCYRCFFKKYGMTQIRRFLHAPNNSLVSVGLNKSIPIHEYTMTFYNSTDYNATLMQNEAHITNLTLVWKHEWSAVRKGWLADRASILFSVMVHSTSSSCKMVSFLRTLTAKTSSAPFFSANITYNHGYQQSFLD